MAVIKTRYSKTKEYDIPLHIEPASEEELFSVAAIDETGIFVLNQKRYSKCFILSDVNFAGMTDEEQKEMIINFSKIVNGISCRFSYTVANEYVDEEEFNNRILYKLRNDGVDELREAFNEIINDSVTDAKQGLYQTIYLTITIQSENLKEARNKFASIEASLRSAFIQIGINGMAGSQLYTVGINERMQKWYNFTHAGIKTDYKFDYFENLEMRRDWRSIISAGRFEIFNEYFRLNHCKYGRVMYISSYSSNLESSIISELSKINCTSYITVNSEIIENAAMKEELNRKHFRIGRKIENEKDRNRQKNDYLADASDVLLRQNDALTLLGRQIDSGDDHYFNTTILIMFLTNSQKELEDITEKVRGIATMKSCEVEVCFNMQREAINSAFLFGIQEFKRVCNFSAPNLAMFMPYKTQELNDENGVYCGLNQLSQNPILADRKLLENKHGVILGMSRKGKSTYAKLDIISNAAINTEDQIMIIDPHNEYGIVASAPGIEGVVISFNSNEKVYVNPLDINFDGVDYSTLQEMIADKTDFVLTLLAKCMKRELDSEEQGVVDRVVEKVFSENYAMRRRLNGVGPEVTEYSIPAYMRTKEADMPTATDLSPEEQERIYSPMLQDIYQGFKDEESSVAHKLAAHMQIFVNGSLNLFNHRTNIDTKKHVVVFNLSGIKENLREIAELIMLQIFKNKLAENFKKGLWTHAYIDELHVLLENPMVADYVIKLWKEVGKLKGILTGITQNMTDLLQHSSDRGKIAAILSNSQYFVLFAQSTIDRKLLAEFLPSISPAMFNFVEGAAAGTGLLRLGSVTIPFDMRMSKESKIYKLVNTDGDNLQVAI